MVPTLRPGAYVLVNRWAYLLAPPAPGDIVVLRHPMQPGLFLVKRIVSVTEDGSIVVGGDNQERSVDGRDFGPIDGRQILGKVVVRLNP